MASRKLLGAFALVVVAGTMLFVGLRDRESVPSPPAARAVEAAAPAVTAGKPRRDAPPPTPLRTPTQARLSGDGRPSLREELRDSTDLYATWEKYKDVPDTTGEFSYRFARTLADCSVILRRAYDRPEAFATRAGRRGEDEEARHAALLKMYERCGRFETWERGRLGGLVRELYARAEAVRYPPAIARSLRREMGSRGIDGSDAIATDLLANSLDADVIPGIIDYLRARDGSGWWRSDPEGIDRQVRQASWVLLQCALGADCGPTSRPVVFGCTFNAFCGAISVEEAFLAQGLTPEQLESAYAYQRELATLIRNRQWDRLGFVPRQERPS